jgi:uncharacterized protein YecT (DUF1311 family)
MPSKTMSWWALPTLLITVWDLMLFEALFLVFSICTHIENFSMRQLLPIFISMLTISSFSTAAVTTASTPPDSSKIDLAQKLNCNDAQTQSDINQCAQVSYQNADKKLNQVYKDIISKLSGSRKQKLITAQQAWIRFKDTSCEFERSGHEGGSIAPTIYFGCLETTTNQRTKQLQEYIQSVR